MTRRQFLALVMPLLLVLVAFVALSVGERLGQAGMPAWDEAFSDYVRRTFAREFVGGVRDERVAQEAFFNALDGYVRTWDNYAEVVPPWDLAERRERSSGRYHGIGVRIRQITENARVTGLEITGVAPGGPADEAGLVIGETIVGVDGRALVDLWEEVRDNGPGGPGLEVFIRGPEGTEVMLDVRDAEGAVRTAPVVRGYVEHGSVFGVRLLDEQRGIAYARISNFHLDTARELADKLDPLAGRGWTSLVLDLRDNSGGILPQAIAVADLFLDEGVIVTVRGREAATSEVHRATGETPWRDVRLVVLLNQASASASEVVAGALQDHGRAAIVGERSYGKFLVQTLEEFDTRFGPALFKRTTAIYETPHGHFYPRVNPRDMTEPLAGIRPDLHVPMTAGELTELRGHIFLAEEQHDWNPDLPVPYEGFVDPPLQAALAVLRGEGYAPRIAGTGALE